MRALRSHDWSGCSWSSVATVVVHHVSWRLPNCWSRILVSCVRQWLKELPPSAVLEAAPPIKASPLANETLASAVTRLRQEIVIQQTHLRTAKAAPLPKTDQMALIREHVKTLAERGRPRLAIERGAATIVFTDPAQHFGSAPDYIACMLAWLAPDVLTRRLESEIDAQPESQTALMSAQAQAQRVAELTATIDGLERQEEALIEQAAAQGIEILRRSDAFPPCVLGVVVVAARRQAQAA